VGWGAATVLELRPKRGKCATKKQHVKQCASVFRVGECREKDSRFAQDHNTSSSGQQEERRISASTAAHASIIAGGVCHGSVNIGQSFMNRRAGAGGLLSGPAARGARLGERGWWAVASRARWPRGQTAWPGRRRDRDSRSCAWATRAASDGAAVALPLHSLPGEGLVLAREHVGHGMVILPAEVDRAVDVDVEHPHVDHRHALGTRDDATSSAAHVLCDRPRSTLPAP
jgi:hypothetical protein